jgi:hypothetical protein
MAVATWNMHPFLDWNIKMGDTEIRDEYALYKTRILSGGQDSF